MTKLERNAQPKHGLWRIPWWAAAGLFSLIAVFFLWEEHEAHLLGALPFVILAACPLIHIFMHRGHGHGHGGGHKGHSDGDNPGGTP